jgi:hypothetical protein
VRPAVVALALTLGLLVGCVASTTQPVPEDAVAQRGPLVDPIIEDHEHADLAAHALSTPNMRQLGHTTLEVDGVRFTSLGEMDWHGTLAVVSAQVIGGEGAIVLVDISDATAPMPLSYATIREAAHPLDVKFDEKGEYVYASGTARILVFDVRDPKAPVEAGVSTPPGAACHMSALGVVGGTEWFFCTGDPVGLTVYQIVDAVPGARGLVPVAHARPSGDAAPRTDAGTFGVAGAPHDMTFQLDPVDGRPLLVVSNRGYGVRVLDVSDPRLPRELGAWVGKGAQHSPLHWHTGMVAMVGGTRYLITSPEILPDAQTPPAIWLLDATEYADLRLVAEWTAPGDHGSPGFTFTTHQWQVAQERLYLGYYHAGVWVLDLAAIVAGGWEEDAARPDVLGFYLPHEAPATEGAMVPNVWDLTLRDGVMWVTDISSGLYALHYAPDALGDPAITGFS